MRISDWSSDVCSSDLIGRDQRDQPVLVRKLERTVDQRARRKAEGDDRQRHRHPRRSDEQQRFAPDPVDREDRERSEEHTSELQSLMRISYAVFCLKKKKQIPRDMMQNNSEQARQ